MEQGLYLSLDVDEALSTFMVNDLPDPVRFLKILVISFLPWPGWRRGSIPEWQLVGSLRLRCGRKVKRMRRFRSNTSRTR